MEFDVFLCHSSQDKPTVRQLYSVLKNRGLSVWIDDAELSDGQVWQKVESVITTCKSAIVCIGPSDIGPWQETEMRALEIEQQNSRRGDRKLALRLIPLLLPGANSRREIPLFLRELQSVDLTGGFSTEGINKLYFVTTDGMNSEPGLETPQEIAPIADDVETVLEHFDGFVDAIDDGVAYITLKSREHGDELAGEYSAALLRENGINEQNRFACKTVRVGGATKVEIEAVPKIVVTEEQIREIDDELNRMLPDDDGVDY